MELLYIFFILSSALFHAGYNFLMHKSHGSRLFLMVLFIIAATCASIVFLFSTQTIELNFVGCGIIYIASAFYVLYQIFVSKAYEKGEISRMYPLTVLSPIFVPIWAFIFLHEHITIGVITGIIISTIGAILVKQTHISWKSFFGVFLQKYEYKGAGFAILASLMYSIGSVFDKSRIADYSLIPYLWVLLTSMALNMIIFSLIFERSVFTEISKISWKYVGIAGILGYASFYTFRAALQHVDVSVAVPIRTSSILFAVFLGVIFAHEKLTKNNTIGVTTIINSILIIKFSV